LQCVAVCCSVLQYVAVCCVAVCDKRTKFHLRFITERSLIRYSVLQCVAVCCSVLQCVAVCCSVLQCVAVCCSMLQCVVLQCVTYAQIPSPFHRRAQSPTNRPGKCSQKSALWSFCIVN